MTAAEKVLIFGLAGIVFCTSAGGVTADDSSNPYQSIVDRNIFGLKPPPPPPDPEANKPPPPKILLAGIMGGFGSKRAIMKVPPQGKPGDPGKETSVMLSVGEIDGDLKLLDIDEKSRTVRVSYNGVEIPLSFESNGVKIASSAPVPAGLPGAVPGQFNTQPAGANPFSQPGGLNKSIPTRTLRLPNSPAGAGGVGNTPMGTAPLGTSLNNGSAPLANYAGGAQPQSAQNLPAPEMHMSPEQQTIMMELERERNRNNPNAPPIPPTELTSPQDAAAVMAPGSSVPGSRQPPFNNPQQHYSPH